MFLLLKEFIGSELLTYKHNMSREFLLLCGVLFKYFWEREILWEWNFSFLQDVLYVFLHLSFPPLLVLPSYFPSSPLSLISASLLCSFLLPSLFFVLVLPFILLWFIPFLFSFFISCLFFLFPYIFSCPYIFPSLYSSFLSCDYSFSLPSCLFVWFLRFETSGLLFIKKYGINWWWNLEQEE